MCSVQVVSYLTPTRYRRCRLLQVRTATHLAVERATALVRRPSKLLSCRGSSRTLYMLPCSPMPSTFWRCCSISVWIQTVLALVAPRTASSHCRKTTDILSKERAAPWRLYQNIHHRCRHRTGSSTDTTALSAAGHDDGLLSPVRSVTSSRGAGRDVRFCLQTSEDDGDDIVSRRDDLQRLTSVSSCSSSRSRPPRSPSTEAGATLSADVARHSIKSRNRPSVRSRTGNGGHNSSAHRGSSISGSTFDGGGLYTVEYLYALPPLFLAAVQRNVAAVKLLLLHGAVPDFVDAVGRTPLHLSASSEFFSWQCAAAMVESGARIRFRSATDRLTAAELCPELVDRQTAVLRDSLAGVDAFCRRHRETVAKRAEQQARAAAAATRAAALRTDHFRFDAGRFFRWSHRHEPTEVRRRRLDSGQQAATGRRTTAGDSVVIDPESESTVWIDCHEDRSDSIISFQSGGRVSFSVRPSVSSRPSQFDDGDVEISQYAADAEKVCPSVVMSVNVCLCFPVTFCSTRSRSRSYNERGQRLR